MDDVTWFVLVRVLLYKDNKFFLQPRFFIAFESDALIYISKWILWVLEFSKHSMITIQSYVKLTDSECDDNVRVNLFQKIKKPTHNSNKPSCLNRFLCMYWNGQRANETRWVFYTTARNPSFIIWTQRCHKNDSIRAWYGRSWTMTVAILMLKLH